MTGVKRSYDSTGRQEAARARRRAIVEHARHLFERDGFQETTIAAVAAAAGVSVESVYKAFVSKGGLAKAVFDFVVAGDDEPVPVRSRPEADAIRAEPDVHQKIRLFVHGFVQRQRRSAPMQILIRDAGHVDESATGVWQELLDERLTGMTMFAEHLRSTGQLRRDIGVNEVRDVLWTLTAVEFYELLVRYRRWPLKRYERWIAESLVRSLT